MNKPINTNSGVLNRGASLQMLVRGIHAVPRTFTPTSHGDETTYFEYSEKIKTLKVESGSRPGPWDLGAVRTESRPRPFISKTWFNLAYLPSTLIIFKVKFL